MASQVGRAQDYDPTETLQTGIGPRYDSTFQEPYE